MVKDVFGPCRLTQWKSQYQISHEDPEHFKVTTLLFKDEASLIDQFVLDLGDGSVQKPLIIFVEDLNARVKQYLKVALRKLIGHDPLFVIDANHLYELLPVIASLQKGAIVLCGKIRQRFQHPLVL